MAGPVATARSGADPQPSTGEDGRELFRLWPKTGQRLTGGDQLLHDEHNECPGPLVYTADPDAIVEKVRRGYHALALMGPTPAG